MNASPNSFLNKIRERQKITLLKTGDMLHHQKMVPWCFHGAIHMLSSAELMQL